MRTRPLLAATVTLLTGGALLCTPAYASPATHRPGHPGTDLGRQVLAPDDGWASYHGTTVPDGVTREAAGTTGGSAATAAEVYVVDTWTELRDALAGRPGGSQTDARASTTPRIIYVDGTIDAWQRPDGTRLTCADFEAQVPVAGGGTFSMADYAAQYDPAGPWGPNDPSGPLEDARVAAAAVQAQQTLQHVGSNVTIVGLGDDAQIVGASLRVRGASNVILRNLRFSDAYDCFPQWDPGDGTGAWNSAYDNVSIWTSTSVWVDHSTFDDGDHPASTLPTVLGATFEVHDGLLDITHGSDLVTASWNEFLAHDKTMLIGSSDSRKQDRGQHRVTLHHNRWTDIGQRAPRVRFGDVHVYNNLYEQTTAEGFQYYWGAGVESSIVAENNALVLADGVSPARTVAAWGGTMLRDTGTLVNGRPADVVGLYAETGGAPLADSARWEPRDVYPYRLLPAWAVRGVVMAKAGAGELESRLPRPPR